MKTARLLGGKWTEGGCSLTYLASPHQDRLILVPEGVRYSERERGSVHIQTGLQEAELIKGSEAKRKSTERGREVVGEQYGGCSPPDSHRRSD